MKDSKDIDTFSNRSTDKYQNIVSCSPNSCVSLCVKLTFSILNLFTVCQKYASVCYISDVVCAFFSGIHDRDSGFLNKPRCH